jgi:hypothetical protein
MRTDIIAMDGRGMKVKDVGELTLVRMQVMLLTKLCILQSID